MDDTKSTVKPVGERVKEGITLLRKIIDLGIAETDPGYVAIKDRINAWIRNEESWDGTADFLRHGRRAYVKLPIKVGRTATVVLKVWKF